MNLKDWVHSRLYVFVFYLFTDCVMTEKSSNKEQQSQQLMDVIVVNLNVYECYLQLYRLYVFKD